jgi:hypothetical protein
MNGLRNAFQNSCLKGCLIYVVALVIVVVLSAVGLGSLSARLGGQSSQQTGVTTQTTSREPAAPAAQPAGRQHAGQESAPTPNGQGGIEVQPQNQPAESSDTAPQAPAPTPALAPQAPGPAEPAPQAAPPPVAAGPAPQTQAQGGVITGQASAPFYIVQSGDTLWDIAVKFDTSVDALRQANKLGEEFIQPGQLLYLPSGNQSVQPPGDVQQPAPIAPAGDQGSSDTSLPAMPHTGINANP